MSMELSERLIDLALEEDIGPGDLTTMELIGADMRGTGILIAKQELVLAGLQMAKKVFQRLDPDARLTTDLSDGQKASKGQTLAKVSGKLQALLQAERTALNFLQRLSGIATLTRKYVETLEGCGNCKVRLVDTRKTTPAWRVLEKYAVRMGGALNHRMGLYDGILVKDNHLVACGGIGEAVKRLRQRSSHLLKIEIEVENMDQVLEALEAGADVIMLDNMDLDQIRRAVDTIAGRALVEVSGGVTLESLPDLAACGVDIISCGALTHSAKAVDISMEIQTA